MPKQSFPFPTGKPTRRQAKNMARLKNIITNPNYSDRDPQERMLETELSKGQKKRIRYHKRMGDVT
jgi:hypothetical protein